MSANGNGSKHTPATSKRARTGLYVRAQPGLKLRDLKVTRLVRKMRIATPWLEGSDIPAARAWAEIEVVAGQVYEALRAMGVVNQHGDARRLLDDYRKLRATQTILTRELGMSPLSRAALKLSTTRAAFELLPAEMIASVNEVGESRKRERGAKGRGTDEDGGE
jgi:hypothetical protein